MFTFIYCTGVVGSGGAQGGQGGWWRTRCRRWGSHPDFRLWFGFGNKSTLVKDWERLRFQLNVNVFFVLDQITMFPKALSAVSAPIKQLNNAAVTNKWILCGKIGYFLGKQMKYLVLTDTFVIDTLINNIAS